ncbi:putative duf221-domain-containing protein [Phaeoacremonium minimum UCRPA7]|uniref:Putative duf221-domain-containing protein n=1 Tax=Phaeoacremonium minimum (strain UCR-PA7) TaxID=1286976 RepID=R8BX65_PHAM7|nr:putative duf221-domain-containing protein [Phaeoacremonium minimum UCRPA7]EOO03927.1 putative duf221-domain-containing protein [Phaeoacremonium minimum UCRPA7]
MAAVLIPVLIPINFVGGKGQSVVQNITNGTDQSIPTGLDTLAWGNVKPTQTHRYWAHLILAVGVVFWVCYISFAELRVYIKVRQDFLTSAEHRLRASANTVLVSSIPEKWLTEEALRGLFDVFPGGIRNIWLTRDFTPLLAKIKTRDKVAKKLESAETELVREAKRREVKKREEQEKKQRKQLKMKQVTKAEKEQRQKAEDFEAKRRAEAGNGVSSGDHEEVPHRAGDAANDVETVQTHYDAESPDEPQQSGLTKVPVIGGGLLKVGQGLKKGVGIFGDAGQGILGGAKNIGHGVDNELERKGGFEHIPSNDRPGTAGTVPDTSGSDRRRVQRVEDDGEKPKVSFASDATRSNHAHNASGASRENYKDSMQQELHPKQYLNTTRKLSNLDEMYVSEETKWWEFWKPPSGGYASPVPQGVEGNEFPLTKKDDRTTWQKIKSKLPFMGEEEEPIEYPSAINPDYKEEREGGAAWEKWLKEKDRPHHRLPLFDALPFGLPLVSKKVDTIYWCRGELARLNMEIEEDQNHPERFPIMNSAFVQFNHQVAAHMACQSVTHHIPKHMAPRIVEISPDDVIWDNMAMKWWDEWARTLLGTAIVFGMVILWAFPVSFSATLSQIDALIAKFSWLGFLKRNDIVYKAVKAVAGVLPAAILALLLFLVPIILNLIAKMQGAKTGSQQTERVQVYYFFFLFVQVFLVVSIASSATQTLEAITNNIQSVPETLAENLPKAANYFFSYMILQALSVSSGTLMQIGALVGWYILARILDNTARSKFSRQVKLPDVKWGSFFPVYTNFACIALIYSVVAPLICLFAIITFSLLWIAHRYSMLYVTRFKSDTGGVLYPRAINQTFTGVYVMELCLIGLFFLVRDDDNSVACRAQGIIMVVVLLGTILYQILLNMSFGPLFRYLPITFEDEAVLRDEAFQRAQDRRLGLIPDDDEATTLTAQGSSDEAAEIELKDLKQQGRQGTNRGLGRLTKGVRTAGHWAVRGGNTVRHATFGKAEQNLKTAAVYRRQQRQKDLEAQRAIGEALYGGYADEIEDLTPEERDVLVRKAFTHSALRSRRPVIWIPRDDLGVSDDEIMRTKEFSDYIWISNEGTALDSKVRAVYGRSPPDFSEVEIIDL